ncbi:MAG TPA: chorismate synthase [Elusimicrobiota bacterium]|nr:chorismate synthase [Elusimicrobiota bacterium]
MRYLTAGESHGQALLGIMEGLPAGLPLSAADIDAQLARRQKGHGRGGRMKIEKDQARILAGVRHGRTIGSPVALLIQNRDWKNWEKAMAVEAGGDEGLKAVHVPRPGHADYVGSVKYGHKDLRNVLERASARETAMRVALGSVARRFLQDFGIRVASRVAVIGAVEDRSAPGSVPFDRLNVIADASPVRCLDEKAEAAMVAAIDKAQKAGDTLGGIFEVVVAGLPVGLGSYAQWDRRLEGRLAAALMSLNAVKGAEVGMGFEGARKQGSEVHDELFWSRDKTKAARKTNRSGGIDGGITTGEILVLRAALKPIATLMKPLASIDLQTREPASAHIERSDVCAVPAAAVIAESLACLVLAGEFLEKYGGDSMEEIHAHYEASRRG